MDKTLEQIRSYAEQGRYKRVPISKELYADAFTPISVMRTLRAASKHCYLLESAEDRQHLAEILLRREMRSILDEYNAEEK